MLRYYITQLQVILYVAPVMLLAIICHECAHGFVSDRLGDPTPRMSGRLTLNPLKHLDPMGTSVPSDLPYGMGQSGSYQSLLL